MKSFLSALLLALTLTTAVTAQRNTPFSLIDSSHGLSNNFVLSLAIDGQGYIWVGTESGLNRVAAGTCNNYKCYPPRNGARGNSNKINALFYDPASGLLFIGTESGLNILHPRTGVFSQPAAGDTLVNYSVEDIAPGAGNCVWIVYGNGLLQQIDSHSLTVKNLPLNNQAGSRCVLDDGAGHLFIGYNKGGMRIVDANSGQVLSLFMHLPDQPNSIPGDNVRRIMKDSHHHVWVGTDHGLALYDPKDDVFHKVTHQSSPFDDNVFDICQMSDTKLWIASDVGGINILSGIDNLQPATLMFNDDTLPLLSSLNSRALVQDGFGNVWVGNHSTGLDFLASRQPPLHILPYYGELGRLRDIHAITNDPQGRLWVNGGDYLSLWDKRQMVAEWRIEGMQGHAHSFARTMMADHQGYVWMGMEDEGVIRFNTRTHQFEHIDITYDAPDVHSFYEDHDGRIWIGSELGVCTYYQGQVSREPQIDQLTRHAPVTSFIRLSPERLLMTTQGSGLVVYNQRTGNGKSLHTRDGLPSENINQAVADGKQGLWLATNAGIVHIADTGNLNHMECLDSRHGLPNTHVQAISTDAYGRLWASTYTGITCYYPDTKSFHHYNSHNLSASGFSTGAVAATADGNIAFGSSNGVFYLNPDGTDWISDLVHPQIVACYIYYPTDEEMGITSIVPDDKGRIELNHRQNTLRIAVTHTNYAHRGYVDFSYMMKGIDNKWYDVGKDLEVVFRSLSPGHYTFILRAKLRSQEWSDDNTEQLEIIINPPFWLSWWAWLLYVAIAVIWALYGLHSYKHRVTLRTSLKIQQRESQQKQELNEERLRFFTNITHELRTPLTLILGPLDDLAADSQLPPSIHKRVTTIQKSAQRLRDLINEILEFRKTETQNRRLTVARGNLGKFVQEVVVNYRDLNRNQQVSIVDDIQPNLPLVYFDSEIMQTVLSNFLSNAMKYTERGSITVSVKANSHDISVSVTDTGYGIAADQLPRIFDRYYQVKDSHQASGTGIGLALVKSLAELHEATLHVDSSEGKGSCFTFTLCIENTYPNALHKEDAQSEAVKAKDEESTANDDGEKENQQPLLLIVEDNDDIREYVAESLGEDFRILQAANGVEGVEQAQQHIPDIIISDIMMPKMDGIELTQQLKHNVSTSHIPIILLTAKDAIEDKETGYESGADSYLTKPFTAKLLNSRIRNIMANRRRIASQVMDKMRTTSYAQHSDATPVPHQEATPPSNDTALPNLGQIDRDFINRLNNIISEHIMQEDIDMAFLTDKMAMSHSTFYRKVKALTGMTAKEYVRKQRLFHCYRLLQSGNYNVSEAAMMTGFNQMAHFRETFKKEFGLLPSEVCKKKKT